MGNDFNFQIPDFSRDIQSASKAYLKSLAKDREFDRGYASVFYEQIVEEINAFDSTLDEAHEVGIKLVSFGESITFHIDDIGFQNPYLIYFYGYLEDGSPIQLVQHVSQISFVMIKMKRTHPEQPKRPIGFNRDDAD